MAEDRRATPFDELAEHVAGLDMLAHTWSPLELLQGAPTDDPENLELIRIWAKNAQTFLADVEVMLAK